MDCANIIFPELEFSSPGTYVYTIEELSPDDNLWLTDGSVYRAVVTVNQAENGTLTASVEYPDGFPTFVNTYSPKPPSEICKCFQKLPFPIFWFAPPQKPEFTELMRSTPNMVDAYDVFIAK